MAGDLLPTWKVIANHGDFLRVKQREMWDGLGTTFECL